MNMAPTQIDSSLVRDLLKVQFPQWADLAVRPIDPGGWCNKTFRLGEQMLVRLPRLEAYAAEHAKEQQWLPTLAARLPLTIPEPLGLGDPAVSFPWPWSIYRWIDGEIALPERIADKVEFATQLAQFLVALQSVEARGGPAAGAHSFHRGGSLANYDTQTRQAIAALSGKIDTSAALAVWETALESRPTGPAVWVHGDVCVGNLLLRQGRLCAVIDFGNLAVGDPACDLSIAWTLFEGRSRAAFRATLALDADTWTRGRGWVLWKALIIASGLASSNAFEASQPWRQIDALLAEHRDA